MRRREFVVGLGSAAASPLAARAQQSGLPVVGMLSAGSAAAAIFLAGFRQGLKDAGYVEGQNIALEFRWAEGRYDRLPSLVAELVRRPVAQHSPGSVRAHAQSSRRDD
jgi:putative ABC transport system substrate-binding protein